MYQGTEELKEMRSCVSDFIKFHQMPKSLSKRMQESFEHTWTFTNGIDMNTVLKSFPESLQADICLHLNRQLLNRCPAFQDANAGCLRMLALQFNSTHVPPGDTLIHKGDNLDAIYFIAQGTLEIVNDDVVMAILDKNDIFGENLSKYEDENISGRAACNVRALTYCDLHKIEKIDLLDILDMYPEFAQSFKNKFQVTYDLRTCELNESKSQIKKRQQLARRKFTALAPDSCAAKQLISYTNASNAVITTTVDPVTSIFRDNIKYSRDNSELSFLENSINRARKQTNSRSSPKAKLSFSFRNSNRPLIKSNKGIHDLQDVEFELENIIL